MESKDTSVESEEVTGEIENMNGGMEEDMNEESPLTAKDQNILIVVDDANVKKKGQHTLNQMIIDDKKNLNILYAPKLKKKQKGPLGPNSLSDNLTSLVDIDSESLEQLRQFALKAFKGEPFSVILMTEPKVLNLMAFLAYSFTKHVYLLDIHNLTSDPLDCQLIELPKENITSSPNYDLLLKYFYVNVNNHLSSTALGSEMWPLTLRVLINIILKNVRKVVSYNSLKLDRDREGVKVDLMKGMALLSCPLNPKLHLLKERDSSFFSEDKEFDVDWRILRKLVNFAFTPKSLLAPLAVYCPHIAYNANIKFNTKEFDKFVEDPDYDKPLEAIDEKSFSGSYPVVSPDVEPNAPVVTSLVYQCSDKGSFFLDRNLPVWLYGIENIANLKISIPLHMGEFVYTNTKINIPQRTFDDIKTFEYNNNKIKITEYLKYSRFYLNQLKNLTKNQKIDDTTELGFYIKNGLLEFKKIKEVEEEEEDNEKE